MCIFVPVQLFIATSPHLLDYRLAHLLDCRLPHPHFAPLPSDLRLPYAGKILRLSCY